MPHIEWLQVLIAFALGVILSSMAKGLVGKAKSVTGL